MKTTRLSLAAIAALCLADFAMPDYMAPATRRMRPCAPDACGPGFAIINNCGTVFYPSYNVYPPFGPEGNISKDMVRYVAATAPKLTPEKKQAKKKGVGSEFAGDAPRIRHPSDLLHGHGHGHPLGHPGLHPFVHQTLPHPGHYPHPPAMPYPGAGYPYPPSYPPAYGAYPPMYGQNPYPAPAYSPYPQYPPSYPMAQPYAPTPAYSLPPQPMLPEVEKLPGEEEISPISGYRRSGDLWLPDLMTRKPASAVQRVQYQYGDAHQPPPGFNFTFGPQQQASGMLPALPQLPGSMDLAANIPQLPAAGFMPSQTMTPPLPQNSQLGNLTPPLPYPSYATMPAPCLPLPPGYIPPPPPQHPCFPSHPYARSPRDFFMWRENMEDRAQRQRPIPLR